MAFRCACAPAELVVMLCGRDRLATGHRRIVIPFDHVTRAASSRRDQLERHVDHRVIGLGPHDGARRPGRRRVGTMLGRDVVGPQFWCVNASPPDTRLLVVDLEPRVRGFVRAVLEFDDPEAIVGLVSA